MIHPVNKKRLAQAIESYKEYERLCDLHGTDAECVDVMWKRFYRQAQHCCDGGNNTNIASLIYNCNESRLNVDTIYYAIVFMGYNEDWRGNNDEIGAEYYE